MNDVDQAELTLASDGVIGTLFTPRTEGPILGVLLIGGSGGLEPQDSARRLAEEGFGALSVAYFHQKGLPSTLREVPLEYFEAALKALRRSLGPRGSRMAVLGVSRGSEAALLSGVHFPELVNAVVALLPGNVVLCSWPPGGPAWTLNGRPLPYVSRFGPRSDDPDAIIPVERIRGPVLLISAGADRVWPSTAMAVAMVSRLKERGHPYPDQHFDFPFAGHGPVPAGGAVAPREAREPVGRREPAGAGPEPFLEKVCEFLRNLS